MEPKKRGFQIFGVLLLELQTCLFHVLDLALCKKRRAAPDPRVILYSLYKFAEASGGYYQFTLSRLYDRNIEGAGVTPYQIFGIGEEEMKQILIGLQANYGDFISTTFTYDLDNINLNDNKTSQDVLSLF